MGYAIAFDGLKRVAIVEEPRRALGPGEVRIRTLWSGISAGTELATYRGTSPMLTKTWDPRRRLFSAAPPPSNGRVVAGYEEVGEVVEAAPDTGRSVGELVYGAWGHRAEAVVPATGVRGVLGSGPDPIVGIFSHIGPTALNGVHDASPRLGETVALFGLGVVGQLVGQLLRRAGARVIAVEPIALRREIAARVGAAETIVAADGDVAERVRALTDGRGADVCVEASGSTRALHQAIRSCAWNSRVVAMGFYQGESVGLSLGEEFHHARITIVSSQIGGSAADLQHRWDRARLVRTFMGLAESGAVRCAELVTHRVPARDAASAFELLDQRPHEALQVVLDFTA
jgi:2-desacetyl-2-hydroxyethyl bacteriochlorophyllide A dehydrogenase